MWRVIYSFCCAGVCIQRTYRMPKDIHVEPERFAAELISRLETVLREREAQERLEERLKRVRLVSLCFRLKKNAPVRRHVSEVHG